MELSHSHSGFNAWDGINLYCVGIRARTLELTGPYTEIPARLDSAASKLPMDNLSIRDGLGPHVH